MTNDDTDYHYLNSCTGFLFLVELILSCPLLHTRALSTQQPPYFASLLHLSTIRRQLRLSISQQLIMPKRKLNLGKRAFSVAVPRVWNELSITLKTSEKLFSEKKPQDIFIPNCISTKNLWLSLVLIMTFARPCSRLYLMILFCCASEDIGAIEVNYCYYDEAT